MGKNWTNTCHQKRLSRFKNFQTSGCFRLFTSCFEPPGDLRHPGWGVWKKLPLRRYIHVTNSLILLQATNAMDLHFVVQMYISLRRGPRKLNFFFCGRGSCSAENNSKEVNAGMAGFMNCWNNFSSHKKFFRIESPSAGEKIPQLGRLTEFIFIWALPVVQPRDQPRSFTPASMETACFRALSTEGRESCSNLSKNGTLHVTKSEQSPTTETSVKIASQVLFVFWRLSVLDAETFMNVQKVHGTKAILLIRVSHTIVPNVNGVCWLLTCIWSLSVHTKFLHVRFALFCKSGSALNIQGHLTL